MHDVLVTGGGSLQPYPSELFLGHHTPVRASHQHAHNWSTAVEGVLQTCGVRKKGLGAKRHLGLFVCEQRLAVV